MESQDKRDVKRSKNFKDVEVECLLNLVKEYKTVLENKKTDQVTFKEKEKVWKDIERRFNINCGTFYRDAKTLRNKYDNLKKVTRRKFSEERKYVMGTGGGPHKPSDISNVEVKVKELMGDLTVFGGSPVVDCDAFGEEQIETEEINISDALFMYEEPIETQTNAPDHIYHIRSTSTPIPPNTSLSSSINSINQPQTSSTLPSLPNFTSSGAFNVVPSPSKKLSSPSPSCSTKEIKPIADESRFSVSSLRKPTSSPIKMKKKKTSLLDTTLAGKKIQALSKSRDDLLDLQKVLVESQIKHENEKQSFFKEEHEKKIKLLDLQIKSEELSILKKKRELAKSNLDF